MREKSYSVLIQIRKSQKCLNIDYIQKNDNLILNRHSSISFSNPFKPRIYYLLSTTAKQQQQQRKLALKQQSMYAPMINFITKIIITPTRLTHIFALLIPILLCTRRRFPTSSLAAYMHTRLRQVWCVLYRWVCVYKRTK